MIIKIVRMEKTLYFYITWHVSIFNSFCGIGHAGNVYFRTFRWGRAPPPPPENFCILIVYAHNDNDIDKRIVYLDI